MQKCAVFRLSLISSKHSLNINFLHMHFYTLNCLSLYIMLVFMIWIFLEGGLSCMGSLTLSQTVLMAMPFFLTLT